MLDFDHNQTRTVDQIMGAAMMVRKDVFFGQDSTLAPQSRLRYTPSGTMEPTKGIGLLDEKFWSTFEEVDFCKRTQTADWKTYFYPEVEIIHHKGESFKQIASLKKQINFNHSLYYYFKKHHPMWKLVVLWLFQPVNLFLTWLDRVIGIKGRVGKRKDL